MFTSQRASRFHLLSKLRAALVLLILAAQLQSKAQTFVENLTVETYYIADVNDFMSVSSDNIVPGTVIYRLHIDLCEGCKLRSIFGSTTHPIEIQSTEVFYNSTFGNQFGHSINGTFLNNFDGSVLDSYLTFGGASAGHLGIQKPGDTNGSIWQNRTPPAALTNSSPEVGIPLTTQDGLLATSGVTTIPINFLSNTDTDFSTTFGTMTFNNSFVSTSFSATAPAGVSGIGANNEILIAQLSTTGDLSFQLNVEIIDAEGVIRTIVPNNPEPGENQNNFLSYPPECGCTDPDFIEFDNLAQCDDGSCANLVVFGCLNETACNYNPLANFDIPELCCFVDSCQGLDISVLCPTLDVFVSARQQKLLIYPNPSSDFINVKGRFIATEVQRIQAIDLNGRVVASFGPDVFIGETEVRLNLNSISPGSYVLLIQTESGSHTALFEKF